jgi:capsular exopolysaccharide synthesis family protein
MAETGRSVVVVSADLRKPRIHRFFGLANDVGLVDVMTGSHTLDDVLLQTEVEGLMLLPCGTPPVGPAELLQSEQMEKMIATLRERFDYVLLDGAPAFVVADSMTLASRVDGVCVVANAQRSIRATIGQVRDQLEHVGARTLGTVLNDFDPSKTRSQLYYKSYYYAYENNYGGDPPAESNGSNGRPAAAVPGHQAHS